VHAEYKVPGGKLVVADVDVEGTRISACRIAGDFFLEPDEALDAINDAIVGLPSTASSEDISRAV
jgi:lipoate-protein ligase A